MDHAVALASQLRQHLRSLRKLRGLTQAQLAALLGVVQSRVADIESQPGSISVDQLLKVLAVLGGELVLRDRPAAGEAPLRVAEPAPEAFSTAKVKKAPAASKPSRATRGKAPAKTPVKASVADDLPKGEW